MNTAPGGWETWSWDESLFAGAAGYYERGRLLDVGCGPGTVTLRLAPLPIVRTVVAMPCSRCRAGD